MEEIIQALERLTAAANEIYPYCREADGLPLMGEFGRAIEEAERILNALVVETTDATISLDDL